MKRIGIIGLGGIATKHIKELLAVKNCAITAICDIDGNTLKRRQAELSIPKEHCFTDYRDLIACDAVDAVEICTPNYLHVEMALAAIRAGKPVNIEKPLSTDLPTAEPLRTALQERNAETMMCFSYRFMPAVRYAKWIIDQGLLGEIVSVDVAYLKSSGLWEGRRLEWRFEKAKAGTGVLGDLGVHLIDMAELLVGKITEVSAMTKIVVKERKRLDSEELAPVETDDYCSFLAKTETGALESFIITRCAIGNQNTIKFDIYGTQGVVSFNLNDPNVLNVCVGEVDRMSESLHTVKVPAKFSITQEQAFVDMLEGKNCAYFPTVADGLRSQQILDRLLLSAKEHRWVTI